ncbi:MAG: C39 family peptidase [Vicinamibacterales bacterium]
MPARLLGAASATILDVPFLPQSEALCGGAAAAMVFRYWGDRHADVQQFASLVDRARGGIEAARLIEAIRDRGWTVERVGGTLRDLESHLARREPPILLLQDRPARRRRPATYHFVVVVGVDGEHVVVHDPTWGPARRIPAEALSAAWERAAKWAIAVRPTGVVPATSGIPAVVPPTGAASACDRIVDAAIAEIHARGFEHADRLFAEAAARCPGSSRPSSELAAVRFTQRRYEAAADLAQHAITLDRRDRYAWDVLASVRFLLDDTAGALHAWNAIDRPVLDSVRLEGVTRTRYARFASLLPLVPNTTLTADDWRLADRRAHELPSVSRAALRLEPGVDGWTTAVLAVLEKRALPSSAGDWAGVASRAAITRETGVDLHGWSGQGELWSAGWRWWPHRPKVSLALAWPATGRLRGVWTVDGFWTAQQTSTGPAEGGPAREAQRHGGVRLSDWATPALRYELSGSFDSWGPHRKVAGFGAQLERRALDDRALLAAGGQAWWPVGAGEAFRQAHVRIGWRSIGQARGFMSVASGGATVVSRAAPHLLWPGAGDVFPTSAPLRAHPLTSSGVIDGPAFGRRLAHASVEQRYWFAGPALAPVGVAAFVDVAQAWCRPDGADRGPLNVDVGAGVRLRLPGGDAALRVDVGRGLRDGRTVVSAGWQAW